MNADIKNMFNMKKFQIGVINDIIIISKNEDNNKSSIWLYNLKYL